MEWSDMRYMGWYGVIGCYRWKIRGLSFIIHHGLWWFIILSAQRPGVLSPSFAWGWPLKWFSSRIQGWKIVEHGGTSKNGEALQSQRYIYIYTRIYKDDKDKNIEFLDQIFPFLQSNPNQAGILAEDRQVHRQLRGWDAVAAPGLCGDRWGFQVARCSAAISMWGPLSDS